MAWPLDKEVRAALFEAHAILCQDFQCYMRPPSETDGRYEDSMRVWNLEPKAREMMDACQQALYDALMKLRPTDAPVDDFFIAEAAGEIH